MNEDALIEQPNFFIENNNYRYHNNKFFIGRIKNSIYIYLKTIFLYKKGLYIYKNIKSDDKRLIFISCTADLNIYNEFSLFKPEVILSNIDLSKNNNLKYLTNIKLSNYFYFIKLLFLNIVIKKKLVEIFYFLHCSLKNNSPKTFYTIERIMVVNDQAFLSNLIMETFKSKITEVIQHGVINEPKFYFPSRANIFYYWQNSVNKYMHLSPNTSYIKITKESLVNAYCERRRTGKALIAIDYISSNIKLVLKALYKYKREYIYIKPHPTSKIKYLYKIFSRILGLNYYDKPLNYRNINDFDELFTRISTVALDFIFLGKDLTVIEKEGLPYYIDICINNKNKAIKELL